MWRLERSTERTRDAKKGCSERSLGDLSFWRARRRGLTPKASARRDWRSGVGTAPVRACGTDRGASARYARLRGPRD